MNQPQGERNWAQRYLEVYRVQFKNNWVREAVYRSNFITTVLVDLVWIVVEFSLFGVIYANTSTLGGWTQDQVYFFLGVFFASDSVFNLLFARNFWTFSDLVNKGELDILLTKPIHPLFLALTRWISLTSVFNIALGFLIIWKYAGPAGFTWNMLSFLQLLGWIGVGCLTQLLLRFAFSIWVFWTDRSWALARLYFQFYAVATKPDAIYPKMIRFTLLTALPFGLIGSLPARALINGLSAREFVQVGVTLLVFLIFDWTMWQLGLRRYQSASS